ncbi:hypothetical protein JCM9803A_28720 [Rhodococcus erythropolis]
MPQPKCGHCSGIDVPKLIRVCMDLPLSEQIAAVLVLVRTAERTAEIPGSTFLSLSATVATIARGAIPVALPLGADRIMDSMRLSVNQLGSPIATFVAANWEGQSTWTRRVLDSKDVSQFEEVDPPEDRSA